MRRRSPIRPGFTMIEVLATLLLLVIFFDAAGKVFRSTVLLSAASQDLCDHTSRIDSSLHQLRADVWNSRAITIGNPHSAELSLADGTKISWKIDSEGNIIRIDPTGGIEQWETSAPAWQFSSDKVSLILSDSSPAPLRLPSQILLAQSERP